MTAEAVDVRIVGATRAQLASIVGALVVVAVFVVVQRRRTVIPFAATRTARTLRRAAQRIEDAGLDLARRATTDDV